MWMSGMDGDWSCYVAMSGAWFTVACEVMSIVRPLSSFFFVWLVFFYLALQLGLHFCRVDPGYT
jgi:hypothetical protein